jgi:hypothetical protein
LKRCNENPVIPFDPYIIPDDIYGVIYQYLSPESKSAFSLVDKQRFKICSHSATAICFLPPKGFSNYPKNIYSGLIERYPNIRKITFKSRFRIGSNESYEKQIRALIKFLNANPDKHPLEHIKEMDLQEIDWNQRLSIRSTDPNNALHIDNIRELNRSLLSALSHAKLESITWKSNKMATVIREQEIQPILEKAVGLKHFAFDAIINEEFNLSFEKQSNLVSASFTPRITLGPLATHSLSTCQNLKALITGYSQDMQNAFIKNAWGLKQLTLTAVQDTTELSFTKQMPHLEFLTLFGSFFLDPSKILELGLNCPNLKELRIHHLDLSEEDFIKAFQGFPNLKLLIFEEPHKITTKICESLKTSCPKLDSYSLQWSSPWSNRWIFSSSSMSCRVLSPNPYSLYRNYLKF